MNREKRRHVKALKQRDSAPARALDRQRGTRAAEEDAFHAYKNAKPRRPNARRFVFGPLPAGGAATWPPLTLPSFLNPFRLIFFIVRLILSGGLRLLGLLPGLALFAGGILFFVLGLFTGGRQILRWLLMLGAIGIGLHAFAPGLIDDAVRQLLRLMVPNSIVSGLERNRRCSEFQIVRWRGDGSVYSILPVKPDCQPEERVFRYVPVSIEFARKFRPYLEAVEGRYTTHWQTVSGVNWWGKLLIPIRLFRHGAVTGGSSLVETMMKNLDANPGRADPLSKVIYTVQAAVYTAHYLKDGDARNQFAATIPVVIGGRASRFGGGVGGGLVPLVLWGKKPEQLTPAELCVWSAAILYQVRLPGPRSPEHWLRDEFAKRIQKIRIRAKSNCIDRLTPSFGWSAAQVQTFKRQIDLMKFGRRQRISGRRVPFVDPARLLAYALPGAIKPINDMLKVANRSPTGDLILSIHGPAQRRAQRRIAQRLRRLDGYRGRVRFHGWGRPMDKRLCAVACDPDQTPADVFVGLFRVDGPVVRPVIMIGNRHFQFTGPLAWDPNTDMYRSGKATRSTGSAFKAVLVPLFVNNGLVYLCNKRFRGIANPNGNTGVARCRNGVGGVPLLMALGRSYNLPFIDGLLKIGERKRDTYLHVSGFPAATDNAADYAYRSVLGHGAPATPMTLVRWWAAVANALDGQLARAGLPQVTAAGKPQRVIDLSAYLPRKRKDMVRKILAAPLASSGTLRALRPLIARYRCHDSLGKTATSEGIEIGAVRDKMIFASFRCRGRRFVLFVLVGSPSIKTALGKVTTRHLTGLVAVVLKSLPPRADDQASQ